MREYILSAEVQKAVAQLRRPELPWILRIQGEIIRGIHDYMETRMVVPVQPLVTSPITDPLNHDTGTPSLYFACFRDAYRRKPKDPC
ncbi:MAG: hypothetical protein HY746_00735 [Elusimicrobia bacterium]|nr:hypothetical protein [Elusimicrobiota bacterium]